MKARRRLCFVQGTWQLTLLQAAVESAVRPGLINDLVVYQYPADGDPGFRSAIEEMGRRSGFWRNVYSIAYPLNFNLDPNLWPVPIQEYGMELKARLDPNPVDEIWLPLINTFSERLVVEVFSRARLMIYEEGLTTYGKLAKTRLDARQRWALFWRLPRLALRRQLKAHLASMRLSTPCFPPSYARRIERRYLFLANWMPGPDLLRRVPCTPISTACLRETIEKLSRACGVMPAMAPGDPGRDVLMLSQPFSNVNMLSWDEELALYGNIIERLLARGYRVVWKEHPRAKKPFFDSLFKRHPRNFERLELPQYTPVEWICAGRQFRAVVSAASSALFYLPRIFQVPAFQYADQYAGRPGSQQHLCLSLAAHYVPSLDDLC